MSFLEELDKLNDPEFIVENWDGYDALPLKNEAFNLCRYLVMKWSTHSDFPLPDPDPVPWNDGNISLEWDQGGKGDRNILSVIPQKDRLVYAFLGTEDNTQDHGHVDWNDTTGLEHVRQLTKVFVQ